MGRRTYSDEEKAAALDLLRDPEQSFYDIHKATGVPVSTLHDWASAAGLLGRSDDNQTAAATQARSLRIALKRSVIAEKLLDAVEVFGDKAVECGARDAQSLMTAAAIALDKFRLEMGEHTSSTRSEVAPASEAARSKLDELAQRRAAKSA